MSGKLFMRLFCISISFSFRFYCSISFSFIFFMTFWFIHKKKLSRLISCSIYSRRKIQLLFPSPVERNNQWIEENTWIKNSFFSWELITLAIKIDLSFFIVILLQLMVLQLTYKDISIELSERIILLKFLFDVIKLIALV